jgi:hypothetical protein
VKQGPVVLGAWIPGAKILRRKDSRTITMTITTYEYENEHEYEYEHDYDYEHTTELRVGKYR